MVRLGGACEGDGDVGEELDSARACNPAEEPSMLAKSVLPKVDYVSERKTVKADPMRSMQGQAECGSSDKALSAWDKVEAAALMQKRLGVRQLRREEICIDEVCKQ